MGMSAAAISLYGFLLPTWLVSSSAVESFSQPNLSAFTAAANPALAQSVDQARTSFQLAQSRVGLLVHPVEKATGRLEFDFIDFSKASPTTASLPRVRRAVIEYTPSDDWTLRVGQDWDLVSPLAPHDFNLVGHYFESGDIGFMRIQAQSLWKQGPWEHAVALGLPGNNNGASDGTLELTVLPTVAWRETYHFSEKTHGGFSALVAAPRRDTTSSSRLFAGCATVFADTALTDALELHAEAYVAQNSYNLGLLGLAFGNTASPANAEAGGYATLKYRVGEKSSVFGGVGGAWALNPGKVVPSYSIPTTGPRQLSGTGPGIESNWTVRLGYEWRALDKLSFFGETAALVTRHHLAPADAPSFDPARKAFLTQIGTMLTF